MAVHRAKWKIIVANVAIALSVIGTLPLISQLAYSRVTTGRASFFFHQTKRERLRDEVEESLDHVNFAMGA